MEQELYRWWLPPPKWNPNGKERLSWHMTAEDAAKLGATRRDDASRLVVRDMHGGGMGLGIVRAGGGAPR